MNPSVRGACLGVAAAVAVAAAWGWLAHEGELRTVHPVRGSESLAHDAWWLFGMVAVGGSMWGGFCGALLGNLASTLQRARTTVLLGVALLMVGVAIAVVGICELGSDLALAAPVLDWTWATAAPVALGVVALERATRFGDAGAIPQASCRRSNRHSAALRRRSYAATAGVRVARREM